MKKTEFMDVCRSMAKTPLTDEDSRFLEAIGSALEKGFEADVVERKKQVDEAIKNTLGVFEGSESVATIIRGLSTKIEEMEAKAKRSLTVSEKYNLKKLLESKKDDIKRAMTSGEAWELQFKAKRAAGALMTTSNVMTGTGVSLSENTFEDPELVVIQYPANFILDAINSRKVARVPDTLVVREQTALNGGATVTAEGNTKPLVSMTFEKKTYDRKKYAGRLEMNEEVEIDFEQLTIQIIQMFEDDVLRVMNDGVLADIITFASPYVSTSLDGTIVDPDIYAVMGAGMLHIQNAEFAPDIIVMNPADVWARILTQDTEGAYKINPLAQKPLGLTEFVTNKIAAGHILIGTRSKIKEQHGDYIVRKGVVGEQFIKNQSTIVGEIFSVLQTPELNKLSWVYMDVEAVKQALLIEVA